MGYMESLSEVTKAFEEFQLMETETSDMAMETLEWFMVLCYDCSGKKPV